MKQKTNGKQKKEEQIKIQRKNKWNGRDFCSIFRVVFPFKQFIFSQTYCITNVDKPFECKHHKIAF